MTGAILGTFLATTAILFQPNAESFQSAHHALSNAIPSEQTAFDRGLTLYYAYNGAQGVRVFQAAIDQDSKFAMGYWGIALSYGPDINTDLTEDHFNRAHAAIERAAALESSVAPQERAYIDPMRLRYAGPWRDHGNAEDAYRAAMASAVARFPTDDDLTSLYVEALLEKTGVLAWKAGTNTPASSNTQVMVSLLDRVLARDPNHIMANHLQIHLYGSAADQTRAVAAAKRLDAMNFAPEDEHLAHMPAHTWVHVGNYPRAVASSKRAISLFDQYLVEPNADRTHRGYLGHDIEIGWGAAMMLGSYAGAKWFANRLATLHDDQGLLLTTALRFGDAKTIAAIQSDPQSSKSVKQAAELTSGFYSVLRGNADAARVTFAKDFDSKDKSPVEWAMAGRLKLLEGDHGAAIADFRKAHGFEDDEYFGEELPPIPVGEIEAFGYYRSGDYRTAETTFRRTIKDFPNDPRALYGLSLTLQKNGHLDEAQRLAGDFHKLWQGADTTLSLTAL